MRSGSLWARETLVLPTSAIDSSFWPTARAEDSESCSNHSGPHTHRGDSLTGVLKTWPTPRTTDSASAEMSPERREQRETPDSLTGAIKQWPTPNSADSRTSPMYGHKGGNPTLPMAADKWPTPKAMTGGPESSERKKELGRLEAGGEDLQAAALKWQEPLMVPTRRGDKLRLETSQEYWTRMEKEEKARGITPEMKSGGVSWPTPMAHDGRRPGVDHASTQAGNLSRDASTWPTPAARDSKGQDIPGRNGGASLAHTVEQGERFHSGPQVVSPSSSGEKSSKTTRSLPRRLSPAFVCWLMGWPWWWTRAERISYAAAEMELYLFRQRWLLRNLLGG